MIVSPSNLESLNQGLSREGLKFALRGMATTSLASPTACLLQCRLQVFQTAPRNPFQKGKTKHKPCQTGAVFFFTAEHFHFVACRLFFGEHKARTPKEKGGTR